MLRGHHRLALTVLATVAGLCGAVPAAALARTYYVSPNGRDGNSGRSAARPWQTVYRVDKAKLKPGDEVLFEGGASYADQPLMPGWGASVSGTSGNPVTFGSYGSGKATLPKGIWVKGERHLVFENFNLGPQMAVSGTGSFDKVEDCAMTNLPTLAVNVIGSHWTIRNNLIDHTGDSGMLLRGSHFLVIGNTITNTGLDPAITYGSHGIYLKSTDSQVIDNTITGFRDNGVSVRYRNSLVEGNTISGGKFGIAYFQWDTHYGTARFLDNRISHTTIAGIYVSPWDVGGATDANIVIRGNTIYRSSGSTGSGGAKASIASRWLPIALSKNKGRYHVHGNKVD